MLPQDGYQPPVVCVFFVIGLKEGEHFGKVVAYDGGVNSLGGEAIFTDIHGGHSDANRDVYNQEHESPDGEMINPIEWAFRQERA